ncbi:MAG: small, acid-soluble spore protein, alpha/beta type [Firmicutes bacterium]|nr:small, acid-soluble spore protein, alpha/beta type [Bacillota bacterium]
MARRRNRVMSDALKYELAAELGVDHIVRKEGFGGVTSRDCGNLVKLAIERAERTLNHNYPEQK